MSHTINKPNIASGSGHSDGERAKVIDLASLAPASIAITELEPANDAFIGKRINRDGSITEYPKLKWWRQRAAQVPASISHMFNYLREARTRNICLIRGTPANGERQPTRRIKAGMHGSEDRGDHGFYDEPTKLFCLDGDKIPIKWKGNPEQAVRKIIAGLGELFARTSYAWFLTASHGLEFTGSKKKKRWTGKIVDGTMSVRLVFITDRPLYEAEALELTRIAQARIPQFDAAISRCVQPNYIKRPHWSRRPDRDVLGDTPTIGWIRGDSEYLAVPDNLEHKARWSRAEGRGSDMADHPDAQSALRGIGSDGRLRQHLKSAVWHLLRANPIPDVVSHIDHAIGIADKLASMVEEYHDEIEANLEQHGRLWSEVHSYVATMADWAGWCLERPEYLAHTKKTIKLSREDFRDEEPPPRAEVYDHVKRVIEGFGSGGRDIVLIAPPGTYKSTLMRTAAVVHVITHPGESVAILVPRHDLGNEQLAKLAAEHPNGGYSAAIWRGRHAADPDFIGPQRSSKLWKMCWREDEATMVEAAKLDVEHSLCSKGRGKLAIKCPFFERCGYQRQKRVKANIWIAAHEMMVHEMPAAFGEIVLLFVDESPLDAFTFGVNTNDPMTLELDALRVPPAAVFTNLAWLMRSRDALYQALDALSLPADQRGVPVTRAVLQAFQLQHVDGGYFPELLKGMAESIMMAPLYDPRSLHRLEWRGKVEADIRPDMSAKEVEAALAQAGGNAGVVKLATLWSLVAEGGDGGRIQMHRSEEGRRVRMAGLHKVAARWQVPTLVCDGTADAELLRTVWPQLQEETVMKGWQQLPRPKWVEVYQCVDRSVSKYMVAIEGEGEKRETRIRAARRLWAAVLKKAVEYGARDIGVITYKSTREWIEANCFVPPWIKLLHHGAATGLNVLERVAALFVIGRPLAPAEAVVRQAEALFGEHIAERDYKVRPKGGVIPIVPDAAGNNAVRVDTREHSHPQAERVRRQVTEAALIQEVGRARAGLRRENEPLDVHLWTDVPVPELGPVIPVLWADLDGGLDWVMLAAGGASLTP